jgi:HAD superfamily hydrolase (TIGR01509 family)
VFDIGGVLEVVDDDAWPQLWINRWGDRLGLAPGEVAARLAVHDPGGSVVTGEVSEAQMRQMYASALDLDDAAADQMMAQLWDAYCGTLDVDLRDFAADLRPRYTTAILSNSADGARREEQRRHGFEDLVDVVLYSHELGLAKPDPAVYRVACARLGVEPGEVVFLDDVEANVATARELGWHAVLHRSTAQSIAAITELLGAHRP